MPSSRKEEATSISQIHVGGVWPAAITPRRDSGYEPDIGTALEVIDYLNSFEIDGIALFGSTGEFIHFDLPDRIKLTQMAIRRSRKPIIVCPAHSTYDGTLTLASEAMNAGSIAALVMPPYYFRYSQPSIREFYLRLVNDLQAPVYLYNIPFFSTPLGVETAVELLETGKFAGIKDSSGDENYFRTIQGVTNREKFRLIIGNDTMFIRGRRQGADGVISGVATMAPELMIALSQAVVSGNNAEVDRLEVLLKQCFTWLDKFPVPAAIKMACSYRGLKVGSLALPVYPEEASLYGEFEGWYREWLTRIKG